MKYILQLWQKECIGEKIEEKEKTSVLDITNDEDSFTIVFENDITKKDDNIMRQSLVNVSNLFKKIQISKKNNKILNIGDIIKSWKALKREMLFNIEDNGTREYLIHMSKYYENYNIIEFLLNNFNIIPFFKLLFETEYNNSEKYLKLYGIISEGYIEYKINFKIKEDKEGNIEKSFVGIKNPNFDIRELKNIFREKYKIGKEKTFNLDSVISGRYVVNNELIEDMEILLKVLGDRFFSREYIISIKKSEE